MIPTRRDLLPLLTVRAWADGNPCYFCSCLEAVHTPRCGQCGCPQHVLNPLRVAKVKEPATVCLEGHSLTDDNAYVRPNGVRVCKTCARLRRDAKKPQP